MEKFPSTLTDIMSRPVTLDSNVNVRDAALLMIDKHIGSIVIVEQGQPVGIVTERDMIERVVCPCTDPCEIKLKDIMSSPLIKVKKETTILEAMRKMRENEISHLIIMNDRLGGVVSEGDVIRAVSIASLTSFSTLLKKR